MIAVFIIFLTLVLAFFEKPHLFKKPIKFYKIIVLVLLVLVAIFSSVQDFQTSIREDKLHAVIDSLNAESNVLVNEISYLRSELKNYQDYNSNKSLEYHKQTTDLIVKNNEKVDTLQNTVLTKEVEPTLTIGTFKIDTTGNKRNFIYVLRALNSNAHILDYKYFVINYPLLETDTPSQLITGALNYTSIIVPKEDAQLTIFLDRVNYLPKHFYLAMEFTYKSKSNKKQVPLRKIYEIHNGIYVREVNSDTFTDISLHLKNYKIWPKFYN